MKVCDLGKKIFKAYDTDCNAVLDYSEMTNFIDALLHEMNFANTILTKAEHQAVFKEFDRDGGGSVTCREFIPELSRYFRVKVPPKTEREYETNVVNMIKAAAK